MVEHLPVRMQERLLELQRVANRVALGLMMAATLIVLLGYPGLAMIARHSGIGRRDAGDPDRQRRPQVAAPPDLTSDLDKAPETAIQCLTRA